MKKKGGTAAGVPRSTGETPSATTSNGAPRDQVCDFNFSILCVFVDGKSPRWVMQIYSLVLNLDRGNQAVSKEAWAFRLLLSAARIIFSRTVIPSLVSDQKPLYGYLDLGATTRRGARISKRKF